MLFELEHAFETYAVEEAREKYRQATETLANLRKGKRPSEIEAIKARLKSAQADLGLARKEYRRRLELNKRQFISRESLDRAQTAQSRKGQLVQEIEADLKTAQLGARTDEIRAAEAEAEAVKARLAQAEWNLAQKRQISERTGFVFRYPLLSGGMGSSRASGGFAPSPRECQDQVLRTRKGPGPPFPGAEGICLL